MLPKHNNNFVKAIIYSDIFDYPLKKKELWKYQISENNFKNKNENRDILIRKKGFYCLKGRENIIEKRLKKEKISKQKILLAQRVVKKIKIIYTIKLIGLSGSIAMLNAEKNDDIDFFIICKPHTIWITRLFILLFLNVLGIRRKRSDKNEKDKICINMLIDEKNLSLPLNMQNLYTAHEVIQMKPIFIRDKIYNKFLRSNIWVKKYLPNAITNYENMTANNEDFFLKRVDLNYFFYFPFEKVAKFFQLWYMKKYKTTEITTDDLLAFYPIAQSKRVLEEYKNRLNAYEI